MKTIVHFSLDFRKDKPQLGGYSRIVNLCGDDNFHIIYTIIFNKKNISEYSINSNIKVYEIPVNVDKFGIKQQILNYKKLIKNITKHILANNISVDILFAHSQILNYFVLDGIRKIINKPLIWEVNVIWGKEYLKKFSVLGFLLFYFQKKILRKSDFIVFQTKGCLEYINNNYCLVSDKAEIIQNGVTARDCKVELKFFNPVDRRKYLFLGRFDELNGANFIIEFVKNYGVKLDLSFIGDGPLKEKIKNFGGNVKYLGSVPRDVMMFEFGNYDFVIIPRVDNIDTNLFIPTKLIEAMFNKSVVICSDVRGLTEVIRDGENGFVFQEENEESLNQLIKKLNKLPIEELKIISEQAYSTVENNFLWTNNYVKLRKVYNRIS
jgi:glycosyltransferase involved in cell wall biosynthesis